MIPDAAPRTWVFVDIDAHVDPAELARIAPGLEAQLREDFGPAWSLPGMPPIGVMDSVLPLAVTTTDAVRLCYCQIQLHAEAPADEQGALAIHGVDANGNSIAHVYVALAARCGVSLSSTTSHELIEATADPECTLTATLPDGRVVAVEICDAVEALTYQKLGVEVSDFNTPSNFNLKEGTVYDHLDRVLKQFDVLEGGYAQVLANGVWTQLGGMRAYRAELARVGVGRGARRQAA